VLAEAIAEEEEKVVVVVEEEGGVVVEEEEVEPAEMATHQIFQTLPSNPSRSRSSSLSRSCTRRK
jgi:hypothetical protein